MNSRVVGVISRCGNSPLGDEPHAVSAVWRTDGTSRNNKRLDGISLGFEVLTDGFDDVLLAQLTMGVTRIEESGLTLHLSLAAGLYHRQDSSNVFTNDISGPDLTDDSKHFRPEIAVIVRSPSLPSRAERLARESAREDVDASSPLGKICCCDVFIRLAFWIPIVQHLKAELVYFAVEQVLPSHPHRSQFGCADAAEERRMSDSFFHS